VGTKIKHRLARLEARVAELEYELGPMPIAGDGTISIGATIFDHYCRFMPPRFRVQRYMPDGWRLRCDDDDVPAPLINFCPYCGAQLCEPKIP